MKNGPYSGKRIEFDINPQPDDTTCGPTCLRAVYQYFGDDVDLTAIANDITSLNHGGTLAVCLGIHALNRQYRCQIYTYNLEIFDPTWFVLPQNQIIDKLTARLEFTESPRRILAMQAYRNFLQLGGKIHMKDLKASVIRKFLAKGVPIITGLSSTYLYQTFREIPETCADDDIRGEPSGHFVVVTGYDPVSRNVEVADPWIEHPFGPGLNYKVSFDRLINSILLGVITYDANLLIIEPITRSS